METTQQCNVLNYTKIYTLMQLNINNKKKYELETFQPIPLFL